MMGKKILGTAVVSCVVSAGALWAKLPSTNEGLSEESTSAAVGELWNNPTDIASRNLLYGAGGAENQPGKSFRFVKEDAHGSNPKFVVEDERGVKWKVKLGDEAQPETAASRFLWAAGYYTDIDYFVPEMRVAGLEGRLKRGANLVGPGGMVRNARLKRETGRKKLHDWSWRDAPFRGTREFNGLRVMMALVDNWDLKNENNAVLKVNGRRIYEVSDLGASFGTNGVRLDKDKAKGNLNSFEHSNFITNMTPQTVSFGTPSVPSAPYLFTVWDYGHRASMRWIGHDIPRADAKWIGQILSQLTPQQITDAFRGAGFPETRVDSYTWAMRLRIAQLAHL